MRYGWLVLVSLLAACDGRLPAGSLQQPIIGGTVDDGDPAVVLVLAQLPSDTSWSWLCTGEIVSPHVVVTAAHCVYYTTQVPRFTVFTGTTLPPSGAPPEGTLLDVAETHFVPTFKFAFNGETVDDVGVLILASPTPIAPLPYNHFSVPTSALGAPVRIIGYGLTDVTHTVGTRYQAPMALQYFRPTTLTLYDGYHSNCEGDSGGPALMMLDGEERIAGITQSGYKGCPTGLAAIDTRIDPYVKFIDGYVNPLDPPAVAAGGACQRDAECGTLPCLHGYCTPPCDPAQQTTCSVPVLTECADVDGKGMCAIPSSHGCSVGGGRAPAGGLVILAVLWATAWLRRLSRGSSTLFPSCPRRSATAGSARTPRAWYRRPATRRTAAR